MCLVCECSSLREFSYFTLLGSTLRRLRLWLDWMRVFLSQLIAFKEGRGFLLRQTRNSCLIFRRFRDESCSLDLFFIGSLSLFTKRFYAVVDSIFLHQC